MPFNATILTLYPEMFPGPLGHSLPGRSLKQGLWELDSLQIRDYSEGKHKLVDDTPYGGGAGMVMRPDVIGRSIDAAKKLQPNNLLIHPSPRGVPLTQTLVKELAAEEGCTFLCSRFEGIDERIIEHYQPLEVSLGDYVLFGGEIAAMTMIEAILRYIPMVLGNSNTTKQESFDYGEESALLLEYPHYTKPPFWEGRPVPEVLTSGHHSKIELWRKEQAENITKERRGDLWELYLEQAKTK